VIAAMQRILDVAHRFGVEIAGDGDLNLVWGLKKRSPTPILKERSDSCEC
jgi:hypothetical protein